MAIDRKPLSRSERSSGRMPSLQRNFSDYLLAIRARWKLGVLLAAAAAGFFFYGQWWKPNVYEVSALLRFSLGSDLVAPGQNRGGSRMEAETALRNFKQDMTGQVFTSQLMDSFTDEENDRITRDYIDLDSGARPAARQVYREGVSIKQMDNSHFVITQRHRDPDVAQLLVRRFVDEYKQFLEDMSRKRNDSAIRFMRLQVEEFRLKVERGELELQKYQQTQGVDLERAFDDQRLQELRNILSGQELDLIQFETYVEEIVMAREEGRPLEELPFIREYGQVATFVSTLVNLWQQRENLAVRYGSRHPTMIQNAAATEAARRGLEEAVREAVNKVRIDYEAKKKTVARLKEEFAEQEKEAERLDALRIEYRNMQTRLATDRGLYQQMLQRQNEMQIQSRLSGPQVEMVDGGGVSRTPVEPDKRRIIAFTVLIFCGLFIAYPIGMELIDGRLRTRQAVEEVLGRNYLGQIPKVGRRGVDPYEVALKGKPRKVIEALRIVHSQFQMAVPSTSGQVIVVSSLIPGEGKSFMSLSLATLMAKHHKKVLVIDCDLRRPSIHFALEKNQRELRLVREIHDIRQVGSEEPACIEEVFPGLHVMSLGENPDDPTEIFEDAGFKQMMQRLRQEYDVIVLDTPPAGVFSDAALLGSISDGYLIVVRHNTHSLRKVRNVIRDLEKNNVGVLGIVFNKVVGKFSRGTDDYHRGKYYSYYAKDGRRQRRKPSPSAGEAVGANGRPPPPAPASEPRESAPVS
jgi:polysaccharide biosynthesis transport protein